MRKRLRQFLELESASGVILLAAAVLAMVWANSPYAYLHQAFTDISLFTINDGLMAIFFLMVGLELKRGFLSGPLSNLKDVMLPAAGAVGGMFVPALIYYYCNQGDFTALKGWSTPVATDIAFALGVLNLFGRRVPLALKLFLLALAIFDDIGAILIIALFYAHGLSYIYVGLSLGLVGLLYLFNKYAVRALAPYLLVGAVLWFALLKAGIHPTIGGVLLALFIPADKQAKSPLHYLETTLHPYVAYLIMPLFALANAGFSLSGLTLDIFTEKVVVGIILGLFIGKQMGVLGFSWLLIKVTGARLPEQTSPLAFYGVALLCGIGFTMSLFLGTLSFQGEDARYLAEVRIGVIVGSIISAVTGGIILSIAFLRPKN